MDIKLYDLIDDEIQNNGTCKEELIEYITTKYVSKFKDFSKSEIRFIAEIAIKRIISYRESHLDDRYNKTIGLILYNQVSAIVIKIREIKESFFGLGRILFYFFKRWMIE